MRQRIAPLAALTLWAAALVAIPMATVISTPIAAQASVSAGDVVYVQDSSQIYLRNGSTGATTNLSNNSYTDLEPDVSPDGSQIAFIGTRPPSNTPLLWVMNSDGSGQTALTTFDVSSQRYDHGPRWSPDGSTILFVRDNGSGSYNLYSVKPDGSNLTQLTSSNHIGWPVAWSPDGSRVAYPDLTSSQLQVANADGSNAHTIGAGGYEYVPDWSPDGTRIYYTCGATCGIRYYTSTDNFATSGNSTAHTLTSPGGSYTDDYARVSADGNTVAFYSTRNGCCQLFSVSKNGGTESALTSTGTDRSQASYINATYPAAPPSNGTVTISAPASSDAPYTRQITVGLSATGNQRFEYGWSTSSGTAPNTSYLQTTTDMTTKKGTLNYLGKYSGSGTTWNGGTLPNQDWYLWVRSVTTGGTANSWGTPLLVHTPKQPVWVGAGDSFSGGHHLDTDQPLCAEELSCSPTDYTPNDPSFSWVTGAASSYNSTLHVPSAWAISPVVIARSGTPTSQFGATGETAGTAAWASAGQAGQASVHLYARHNSWNIVSMTGGANDKTSGESNFADVLASWYIDHSGDNYGPWAVPTNQAVNCPNTEALWINLETSNLNDEITANLQGMVTVATNASPGVRVIDLNYPYSVDSGTQTTGNPCYSDWTINSTTYHGVKSVVDALHSDHAAVTGSNVKHGDLRLAFGTTGTVSNGYIQLTRLYGYPHPSSTGQSVMATTAAGIATGSGW